ncbi:androgen-induced gene 1 protein isoform X1 [Halyomorpha halys]|uniref:androgen-induced gene 1 protein isoform X1 n=1 Tax=Halyomorpha halys TaxID=286706 RepID=UPI0006D4D55A|nr:androgen-induced gene 1 protein-like isoform X1 [Halyomorpha halys]XP_014285527.1 androgen-induced gene 1 protein-like isoform X1 [Halyomorpha halys]XP_014285528.1 androgen-induced gene 1 protein-like isoform X1 [Halyomorpha halys]XP_014285529.1 androgen-induced gene 1 protein-like isoform X1 [Halyomorpha halys]
MPHKISFWDRVISKPRALIHLLHVVTLSMAVWSISHAYIIISTTEIDFSKDKYFKHAFENKEFLFSVWATCSQVIYFGIYLLIDVINISTKKSEQVLKIRETLYNAANFFLFSIVFPLTLITSFLFWVMYFWDKEKMYPKQLDMFPFYLNHMMHTMPLPGIILYMFSHVRKEPNKYKTLLPLVVLLILYNECVFGIRRRKGVWVYPVFNFLTFSQVQVVAAITMITSIGSHFLGYYLFNILKGVRLSVVQRLKKMEKTSALKQKHE